MRHGVVALEVGANGEADLWHALGGRTTVQHVGERTEA